MRLSAPRRAAVLGSPVAHSLSPVLHRAAYAALGLDGWTYEAIECDEAAFPGVLAALDPAFVGLSCTMPLKRVALAAATTVAPAARLVGAVNTLVRADDGWSADNTDVDGVLGALAEAGTGSAPESVLLLGAGGTAQAVVVALARLGVTGVTVGVRDTTRAAELRSTAERAGVVLDVAPFADRLDAELVVSTLPGDAAAPLAGRLAPDVRTLLDVVYAPWPTTLARSAAAAGAGVVGGRAVLLHQAARQVELMTGRPAPLAAMAAALPA
ncbi:shikimate dehydrogenase [Jatrophihabitans sp. YIM 134969]